MAIRNTNLGGATDWIDGEVLDAPDLNDTFDAGTADLITLSAYKLSKVANPEDYSDWEQFDTATSGSYNTSLWSAGRGYGTFTGTYSATQLTFYGSQQGINGPDGTYLYIQPSITANKAFVLTIDGMSASQSDRSPTCYISVGGTNVYAQTMYHANLSESKQVRIILLPYEAGKYQVLFEQSGSINVSNTSSLSYNSPIATTSGTIHVRCTSVYPAGTDYTGTQGITVNLEKTGYIGYSEDN